MIMCDYLAGMATLRTSTEIIDQLGGTAEVSRLTGKRMQNVSRWKGENRFPPDTYLCMTQALEERGHRAPVSLWGQRVYAGAKG